METFYSRDLKTTICQIQRRTAAKLFAAGKEIFLHSSNMRFDNMLQHPMACTKDGFSFAGYTFDQICNLYENYNCDNERGRYIHFFVKEQDVK